MPSAKEMPSEPWRPRQALLLAAACLIAGVASGWLIRLWNGPVSRPTIQSAYATAAPPNGGVAANQRGDETDLRQMADTSAATLLRQLQTDPSNPDLLTRLGNLYYDARQYSQAADYYARALQTRPSDADVRTDMGTAYWYMGNADAAIGAFNQALANKADNPNTLFNLGIVRWKGKGDASGAVAAWERLLATNPTYENRAEVEKLISEAQDQKKSR